MLAVEDVVNLSRCMLVAVTIEECLDFCLILEVALKTGDKRDVRELSLGHTSSFTGLIADTTVIVVAESPCIAETGINAAVK